MRKGCDTIQLDDEFIDRYRRDGVVCLRGVFDQSWLDITRAGIGRNLTNPGPFFRDHTTAGSAGRYVFDFWTWRQIPEFRRLVFDSPAAAIAGQLMLTEAVSLAMDNWFLREAGAADGAPWHHDEPYFDFEGPLCVIWIPLEDVRADEGLTFVRGSHDWGRLFVAPQFSDNVPFESAGEGYEAMPDIDGDPGAYDLLTWNMRAGDCLAFDIRAVHGATTRDRALTRTIHRMSLRFAAPAARFRPRGAWTQEISDHLIAEGQVVGAPLNCPLTPEVWRR
jgi:ectoine hydroxylase-related dioxygenase (phytanoyl-CoA dioxygenase family)